VRGLAVLVMVLSHVTDSWTHDADRGAWPFWTVAFIGGLGAPLFLCLAGVSLALAATPAARRGTVADGARRVRRRGWQIFGLAFLFRLQALVLGWGDPITLLTVDILNVMGLSLVGASWLWQAAPAGAARLIVLCVATAGAAAVAPPVWTAAAPAWIPEPLRWYLQPTPGHTNFTLLPWAGFLFAGVIVGEGIVRARDGALEMRLHLGLAAGGALVAVGGWAASYGPAIFQGATFWGSSPAFFAVRLGIVVALIAAGWGHHRFWYGDGDSDRTLDAASGMAGWRLGARLWSPVDHVVATLGRSSLFVYWIHVEMVYGVVAEPIKQRLPLTGSLAAVVALGLLLYALVRLKQRWVK